MSDFVGVFRGPVWSSFFIDGTMHLLQGSIYLMLKVLCPKSSCPKHLNYAWLTNPWAATSQGWLNQSAFRPSGNQTALQPVTQSAFKPSRNQTAFQ